MLPGFTSWCTNADAGVLAVEIAAMAAGVEFLRAQEEVVSLKAEPLGVVTTVLYFTEHNSTLFRTEFVKLYIHTGKQVSYCNFI